ncbi:MAG: DUF6449 domain-containing protein [Eubacteriales bacterium]|nr:DUF6449 domain-containing protein [Eubacteriales bacterium]
MTSRSSFFDLLKENMKRRLWSIALSVIVFLFYFPIATLMYIDFSLNSGTNYDMIPGIDAHLRPYLNIFSQFKGFHIATDGGVVISVIIFFAVLMGVSAFTYLHDKKTTDFFHSLPVSRKKIFLIRNINSVIIVAVPYLVFALISALIVGMYTGVLGLPGTGVAGCMAFAFKNYLAGMCVFLLIYATTVLAMMLTAHRAVAVLALIVFFFYLPAVLSLAVSYMEVFFHNYYAAYEKLQTAYQCLSPLYWVCMDKIDPAVQIAGALIGGILLLTVSGWLYGRRRSETAGQAMVFSVTKAPIRIMIVIPASLAAGIIFYSMMKDSTLWGVFGMAAAAVLTHALIEIIYHFDFRKLLSHKLQLILSFAAAACVFAFFRFDVSGYDSRIPDDSKVATAGICTYYLDDVFQDDGHIVSGEDGGMHRYSYVYSDRSETDVLKAMQLGSDMFNAVRAIAEDGIANSKNNGAGPDAEQYGYGQMNIYPDNSGISGADYRNIVVVWHLKNGRDMYRSYSVDVKKLRAQIDSIYDTKEYKYAVYPLTSFEEGSPERDITGVNYQDCMSKDHLNIAEEDIDRLYETYCRELLELTAEDRRSTPVVCDLQFKSRRFQQMADEYYGRNGYLGVFSSMAFYPVYESFDETLRIIDECGADINGKIRPDNINALVISGSMYDDSEQSEIYIDLNEAALEAKQTGVTKHQDIEDMIITDTDEIAEILDCTEFSGLDAGNSLYPYFYGVNVTAYIKDKNSSRIPGDKDEVYAKIAAESAGMSSVMLYFRTDNIPESIRKHFRITDAELKKYGTVY